MQKFDSIPNIIFDFGGVILNIDPQQAVNCFNQIGLEDIDFVHREYLENGLFDKFEKGLISASEFRNELRKHLVKIVSDEEIDTAWNAMLLDLPKERLELLEKLKINHRLFLLSNTNIIHWEAYMGMIQKTHGVNFSDYFEKDYYSHNMDLRKPDPKIFTTLLEKENIIASETLFIDDMYSNIEAASKLGMHVHHLQLANGESILDLFSN